MKGKKLILISIVSIFLFTTFSIHGLAVSNLNIENGVNINKESSISGKWHKEDGQWYFVEKGVVVKGWLKDNDKWYYLDKEGIMQTKWIKYKNEWYYLNESGVMQIGWILNKGKYYYLKENGSMAHNEYIDRYYVRNDGSWDENN